MNSGMKILKIVAGVAAVLIVGVVVVLLTVDVGKYTGLIQEQAKAATGREVTIGDIKLSLSLTPAIVVSDVKVANASWGSRPDMLTLKRLEARTQLIPLLFGTVNISGLKLVEPDVMLETDPQGKGNWEFGAAAPASSSSGKGGVPAVNISSLSVEGVKLAYRDGKTKGSATAQAKTADIDIEGALAELNFSSLALTEAAGSYSQGATAAEGSVAKLSLNAAGPITDLNITKLELSDAKGRFKDGASAYEGTVGSLAVSGEKAPRPPSKPGQLDVARTLKALNLTSLTLEKATASLKDSQSTTSAVIGKVVVAASCPIGGFGITNLAVTGSTFTSKGEGAAKDIAVESLSLDGAGVLALVAKIDGQDVKATGTLAPIASLAAMNKSFPAKVKFDGYGLKGDTDLVVDLSRKRRAARGTLTMPELDLAALTKGGGAGAPPAAPAAKGGRMFSDESLPWDIVTANDADVKIAIGKLALSNGIVLTNVVLPVDLAAGKLTVRPASFGVAGGTVSADIAMDAGDKSFALNAEAKGITAEALARELKKTDLITQGPIDLNINLRGAGTSVHALMASLNGSVIAGMGESRVRNDALNIIGADVIMQVASAINPLGNKDPYAVARCAVVNFQIAGGVANTNGGIALVTEKMQVTSSGKIDLGAERVDMSVRPKATGGFGVGLGTLAQAIRVSGSLSAPGIGIDKAGAIKTLGTLGAAFATGSASILAQSAKDKLDSGDPCQAARTWHLKK